MNKSPIEWTDDTWNPVSGCSKVSLGCIHCYAERMAKRLAGRCGYPAENPFAVTLHPDRLGEPLHKRKPRRIFVCSMSDLFHEDVPDEFIAHVLITIRQASRHTFLVLTKRPVRMLSIISRCADAGRLGWVTHNGKPSLAYGGNGIIVGTSNRWPLPNLWLGVSVENQKQADLRIPHLLQTPAAVRFVSLEPLLSSIDLSKYMGYNSMYENEKQRISGVRSREIGVDGDHGGRHDLENGRNKGEPMEQSVDSAENSQTPGRTRSGPISSNTEEGEFKTRYLSCSSTDLVSLQWPDTGRADHQSQKRSEEGQQTGESGIGNNVGTNEACVSNGIEKSIWGEKSSQQINKLSSRSNQNDLFSGRDDSIGNSKDVRSGIPINLEDRPGGASHQGAGEDGKLCSSPPTYQSDTRQQGKISLCIVGGESGPGARPMHPDWVRSVRDQCAAAGVPFFMKQMGAAWEREHGRGHIPDDLKIRELPNAKR